MVNKWSKALEEIIRRGGKMKVVFKGQVWFGLISMSYESWCRFVDVCVVEMRPE